MSPIQRLLKEAHRRGLWQVLVVFVGGGWGVLGVIDTLIGYGYLPTWVFGGGLIALLAGLPLVSATAWIQGGLGVRPWATAGDPEDEARLAEVEAERAAQAAADLENEADDDGGFDPVDFFTWPRAITGGVLAFALLGVLAAGFMMMRVTGIGAPGTLVAQGVLDDGALMVLADFESSAGDAAPGDLLTESLRIDLAQSDALRLLPEREVQASLARMLRDPAESITEDVALEIAEREGAAAVIAGEVGRVGSGFTINGRVLEAASGEPLATFRVTAADEDELLEKIDELSRAMRDKIGESLRSIAGSASLESVATSSIEALRRFTSATIGLRRGTLSGPVAQQLFSEAVAIDSTFSGAHRALAIAIFNFGGDRELMNSSMEAAYRHRARLPEAERLSTEATYHRFVGDPADAARSYRAMLAIDPTNEGATANLTDILMYAGEYEEAIEVSEAAPYWDNSAWSFNYLASLAAMGRFDEASAVGDSFYVLVPDDPYQTWREVMILQAAGRPADALAHLEDAPPNGDPLAAAYEQYLGGVTSVGTGQLRAADELFDGAIRQLLSVTGPSNALAIGLAKPWVAMVVANDPERGHAELESLKRVIGWDDLSHYNRAYPRLAVTYALLGLPEEATALLDTFDVEVAAGADPVMRSTAEIARGILEAQSNASTGTTRLDQALPTLFCARCADVLGGLGHEVAGDPEMAIEAYERYLDYPFFDGGNILLHLFAVNVHERLGRLHDQLGNGAEAAEHYRRFAELWENADPDLQPRVRHARERAAALDGTP